MYHITMGGNALEQSQNPLFEHAGTATTGTAIPGTTTLEQPRRWNSDKNALEQRQNFLDQRQFVAVPARFVAVPV